MRLRRAVCALVLASLATRAVAAQTQSPTKGWPVASPAAVGLDVKVLAALDAEFASGKYGNVDAILVIRHGKVAYDRSYKLDYDRINGPDAAKPGPLNAHDPSGPYNYLNPWWHPFYHRGDLHSLQSVTKTITSVVIGVATTRKAFPSLDTPVLSFFDTTKVANIDDRKRRMTIRHLLTMTAGFSWNENLPYTDPNNAATGMEASPDWIQYTIDRPMEIEPGTAFNYNSGATELLSHIFRVATGIDVEEYAQRYLFTPLGITHYFWKRTPTGAVDTEGGLYLEIHDLAKIAYLFLENGVWDGKPVVSPEWVKASITPAIAVAGGVKYGLKWWLYSYGKDGSRLAFGGSGFGGQRPLVIPEYDLVIVFTGWNVREGSPNFPVRVAIDRIVGAVTDQPGERKH